jgi:hypothetical protein
MRARQSPKLRAASVLEILILTQEYVKYRFAQVNPGMPISGEESYRSRLANGAKLVSH